MEGGGWVRWKEGRGGRGRSGRKEGGVGEGMGRGGGRVGEGRGEYASLALGGMDATALCRRPY